MRTAGDGRYIRDADGWYHAESGVPVEGAEDMTISSLYNLPVYGPWAIVPRSLARNEPNLTWCLAYADTDGTVLDAGHRRGWPRNRDIPVDAMLVPLAEWDARAREPIGMWAPELAAAAGLGI